MSIKVLKRQLEALQFDSSAIQFEAITDDMNLEQATRIYNANLKASRSYYPRPTGDMPTLEQATKIYNEQIRMPARNIQRISK